MCDRIDFEDKFTGESSRTFGERFEKHLKVPYPIYEHQNITDHTTSVAIFKVMGGEWQNTARGIIEAVYIRVNNPTLHKNIGKFNLLHIWYKVLCSTQNLK